VVCSVVTNFATGLLFSLVAGCTVTLTMQYRIAEGIHVRWWNYKTVVCSAILAGHSHWQQM